MLGGEGRPLPIDQLGETNTWVLQRKHWSTRYVSFVNGISRLEAAAGFGTSSRKSDSLFSEGCFKSSFEVTRAAKRGAWPRPNY